MSPIEKHSEIQGVQELIEKSVEKAKAGESVESLGLHPNLEKVVQYELAKEQQEKDEKIQKENIRQEEIHETRAKIHDILNEGKINPFQKKEVEHNFGDHPEAVAIYNEIMNIGAGAQEGLREDFKEKIKKYLYEIVVEGKDPNYVLSGLPFRWRSLVESKLPEKNISPSAEQKEKKKNFDDLSFQEIDSFVKSLPKVPVGQGSRMTMIDPLWLGSKSIRDLKQGDKIYTLHSTGMYVTGEVLPKSSGSNIGQIRLKLDNGTEWTTNILIDAYTLEDIKKAYERR